MRFLSPSALILSSLILAAPLSRADDSAPAAPAPAHPPKKESTELEDRMSEMGKAFKKLRGTINDASQNAASLELVAKIRKGAEASLTLKPAKTADVSEADRAKFLADYEKDMKGLIAQLDELTAALKANDNEKAAKIFKDIGAAQREAHKEFRRPQQ